MSQTKASPRQRLLTAIAALPDLERIEETIRARFCSDAALLREIPAYLLELGGKRMRPVLALLSARLFGMERASPPLLDAAAAIELIHMATLMHDDIIDNSLLRRRAPSPLARFGSSATLLAGDFLLVRAFALCARLDAYLIAESEKGCVALTEGEILETPLHLETHSLASSINIARKKTASLFCLAARSGAYLADAGLPAANQMAHFGEDLGIAFQILDDVLDVVSERDLHGKQSGIDLRERKPSVVNVLWLASGSPLAEAVLRSPEERSADRLEEALLELRQSPAVAQAKQLAADYAERARAALQAALEAAGPQDGADEALAGLEAIIDYTLERAE